MADSIATAYIQLVASADGLSNSVSTAMGEAGTKSGNSFATSFGNVMKGAGAVVAGTAAAVGTVVGVVSSAVSDVAAAGDEIDKTSQKVGVSASDYQALAFAAEHCGFETSTLQTAAKSLANTDFDGNLTDALNTIMAVGDADERTALAQELLGTRAAQSMAAFINGEQSVSDYKDQLSELGGLMSDESVTSAAGYEDAMTNLSTSFEGLKTQMVSDFLPGVTQVMDGLALFISGDEGGLAQVQTGIESFIGSLNEKLPEFLEFGVSIITTLAESVIANLPMLVESALNIVMQLATSLIENLPTIAQTAVEIILTLVTGLAEQLPTLIPAAIDAVITIVESLTAPDTLGMLLTAAFELIQGLAVGLIDAIPRLLESIPVVTANIITSLISAVPQLIECGVTLLLALVENLPGIIIGITNALPQIISSMVTTFTSPRFIAQMTNAGWQLLNGLKQGIMNFVPTLVANCQSAMNSVIATVKGMFGIHSPSKVFAGFGKMNMQGLANGIEDNIDLVDDAMGDVEDSVLDSSINSNIALESGANNGSVYGGVQIIVNAAAGQSEETIAEIVSQKLAAQYSRQKAVFA